MLQPIADKSGNVAPDMDRHLAGLAQQSHGSLYDLGAGFFVLNDLDQRHQVRRIPEMRADHPFAVGQMAADLGRRNRRAAAGKNRVATSGSTAAKISCLSGSFSGAASKTQSAPRIAHRASRA